MKQIIEVEPFITEELPCVNYHLIKHCNMKCRHCFATFSDVNSEAVKRGMLPLDQSLRIIDALADHGFQKINFVGGEPLLCPWIDQLILRAKSRGMTTSIVTNGSLLTSGLLDRVADFLDWAALSIDSGSPETHHLIGRSMGGRIPITSERYVELASAIKDHGIRFKVNTVVNRLNFREKMSAFLLRLNPARWKVFQVLPVEGQNDGDIEQLTITQEQFDSFLANNEEVSGHGIVVCPESNNLMRGSYVMVDPAGRFFDNTQGGHQYSQPILDVGVQEALSQVKVYVERFLERGGLYNW